MGILQIDQDVCEMGLTLYMHRTRVWQRRQQADAGAVVAAPVREPVVVAQVPYVEYEVEANIQRVDSVPRHDELYELPFVGPRLRPAFTLSELSVVRHWILDFKLFLL